MSEIAEARMQFFKQAVDVLKSPEERRSEEDNDPRPCLKEITAFGQVVQETLARLNPMQRSLLKNESMMFCMKLK